MKIDGSFNSKSVITEGGVTLNVPGFMPINSIGDYLSDGTTMSDEKLLTYYLRVPELQAIINYRGGVFASMRPRMKNLKTDTEVENHAILDMLKNPNALQNFTEFANQASILKDIFGNAFIHNVFGTDPSKPQALWNLPSGKSKIIPVKNRTIIFNQTDINKIIEKYIFEYIGGQIEYKPEEIIHSNDVQINYRKDVGEYLKGTSKVQALSQACQNIITAYEARGILQGNSPMGIVTNKTKDSEGSIPLIPTDKIEIQEKLQNLYGLSKKKMQFILSGMDLDFISMSTDIKRLQLFEEVNEDQGAIADQYAFPIELLQPDATHANKKEAKKQLYQDSTIPDAIDWLTMLSKGLGLLDQNLTLYPDYTHVPVLQDDLEKRTKMWFFGVRSLNVALEDKAITIQEYQDNLRKLGILKAK